MSREEAIEIFKRLKENAPNEMHLETIGTAQELFDMAIKALSQEPCEECKYKTFTELYFHTDPEMVEQDPCDDAISREAVFNAIEREDKWLLAAKGHNGLTEMAFSGLKARVDALPSVTQKTGKWIRDTITDLYHCSECRSICHQDPKSKDDYCRYCGAKMVEPQESEDNK